MTVLAPARPLYATPRHPEYATRGGEVAAVSREMGFDPMPWQGLVMGTALEVDGGLPRYSLVVCTVCRQNGKTTGLVAPVCVHRLLWWTEPGKLSVPQIVVYGAQTLKHGVAKWRDEIWPILQHSGIAKLGGLKAAWSLADPHIRSSVTGSVLRFAGMAEAEGHGATVSLAVLDEAWKMPDSSREQALLPAMVTVEDSQMWQVSTAGTFESTYFRGQVERGRDRVAEGRSVADRAAFF